MDLDLSTPGLTGDSAQGPAILPGRSFRLQAGRTAAVWVTRKFQASPERLFDAWLAPAVAGEWLFATASRPMSRVTIDARVGGSFRFVERSDGEHIEHSGVYIEIDRPWRLGFTLSMGSGRAMSRVLAEFVPLRTRRFPAGCEVIVTLEGLPRDRAARMEARWTGMLYGLDEILTPEQAR